MNLKVLKYRYPEFSLLSDQTVVSGGDSDSSTETGVIKGCLNLIKKAFYWFLAIWVVVVLAALWSESQSEREEEEILAAEAKLEGFESVTEYKVYKKKLEEQQDKIEEEKEARSYGFDSYEAYRSFRSLDWGTRSERLSEHKEMVTAEAKQLGFDSLAQYMDSRSRGVFSRKREKVQPAQTVQLSASEQAEKRAREREEKAEKAAGKEKLAQHYGFETAAEYQAFIDINPKTAEKRLERQQKREESKARRLKFSSLEEYMVAKSNGFFKKKDWDKFLKANSGYDIVAPDWVLSPSQFLEGHFSASSCERVVSKNESDAKAAAMKNAREEITRYIQGMNSAGSPGTSGLVSNIYMSESARWFRDGQPAFCVLASINYGALRSAMDTQ